MKSTFYKFFFLLSLGTIISSVSFSQITNFNILSRDKKANLTDLTVAEQDRLKEADTESIEVSIFGNGGLRNAVMNTSTSNTPINGSLGACFATSDLWQVLVGFTVNDFQAIEVGNSNAFGKNLLIPDIGGQSFTLAVKKYFSDSKCKDCKFFKNSGAEFSFIMANAEWKLDDSITHRASPLALRINYVWDPFGTLHKNKNSIALEVALGLSVRAVIGDITNYTDEMQQFYGTSKTFYFGPELGVRLVINNQCVFINIPYLFSKDKVDGLTGAQVIIGATLSADFIKL
jgi:hypothetical protein